MAVDPITTHPDHATLESWWLQRLAAAPDVLAENGIAARWWGYRLFGEGTVQDLDELNQTLTVIIGTPQGSDIHRPTFSTGVWDYIDYPLNRVGPYTIRESVDAVETWEPRLELTGIAVTLDNPNAKLSVNATWQLSQGTLEGSTEVSLG